MKRQFLLFAGILILLTGFDVFAGGAKDSAAGPIVIKFAHFTDVAHPGHIATLRFAERVTERTNGAVKFEIYPNNELGNPPEVLEQNILGVIDMSTPTQGSLDKYSKKFAAVMCPFVFDGYEHAWKVLDGPFQEWAAQDLEAHGLILLSTWEYGFRQITNSVRPVNTVEDLRGLKMRVPPEVQFVAAFNAAGSSPQQIAFSELYLALQQSVVDGQENPLATIFNGKLYETQPYLAISNHIYSSQVHVISKTVWDKLTQEQREIIKEESLNAGKYMRELVSAQENDYIEKLKGVGMKVTYPNLASFRDAMLPAYDEIRKYAGEDNVNTFLKMADSLR
jgi:tripartite ATP-independent transporter DctP family solute receptor